MNWLMVAGKERISTINIITVCYLSNLNYRTFFRRGINYVTFEFYCCVLFTALMFLLINYVLNKRPYYLLWIKYSRLSIHHVDDDDYLYKNMANITYFDIFSKAYENMKQRLINIISMIFLLNGKIRPIIFFNRILR